VYVLTLKSPAIDSATRTFLLQGLAARFSAGFAFRTNNGEVLAPTLMRQCSIPQCYIMSSWVSSKNGSLIYDPQRLLLRHLNKSLKISMSARNFLLAAGICVGTLYCLSDRQIPEVLPISRRQPPKLLCVDI
jgi:hypothetical protein